jgi:hypothetical protein
MHSSWVSPWLVGLALCAWGCLQKVRVVDDDIAGSGGVVDTSRSCSGASDCPAAQTCCLAGLLGRCVSLEKGARCPLPDLSVSALAGSLRTEQRSFATDSERDACALEKRCVGGAGLRRLLRFGTRTANTGKADLLLGAPGKTPGFEPATCDGQPYLADYLHYTLFDSSTGAVVVAEGQQQALCETQPTPASLLSRFDCQFMGLWQGFSEVYAPDIADCQWVDITDVAPGQYVLRLEINPGRLLPESDFSNNTADVPITLPTGDPLAKCPVPYDGLSGYGTQRECGWSSATRPADAGVAPVLGAPCTPGAPIRQGCSACTGAPMLRACNGTGACSAGDALAVAIPADPCPLVSFTCPQSGRYSLLVANYGSGLGGTGVYGYTEQPAGCEVATALGDGTGGVP